LGKTAITDEELAGYCKQDERNKKGELTI